MFPSHCSIDVQQSTEQGLSWRHTLCCERRILQEEGPGEVPGEQLSWESQALPVRHMLCRVSLFLEQPVIPSLLASSASSAPAQKTLDLGNGLKLHLSLQWSSCCSACLGIRAGRVIIWWKSKKPHFSWAIALLICITLHTYYIYIWNLLLLRKCFFNEED